MTNEGFSGQQEDQAEEWPALLRIKFNPLVPSLYLGSATALPTGQFWAVGSVQWAVQPALHYTAHRFQWAGR